MRFTMRFAEVNEGVTQKHQVKYSKDGVIEPVIDDSDAPPDTKIKWRCTIEGDRLKIEMEGIGVVEFKRVQNTTTKPVEKTTEGKTGRTKTFLPVCTSCAALP